jgi:hypothetical protein
MRPLNSTISARRPGKRADRQQRADRHADEAGDQRCGEAHAQAEEDDGGQPGVGGRDQLPGGEEGVAEGGHAWIYEKSCIRPAC